MTAGDWRDRWDDAASAEAAHYDTRPVAALLDDVRAGRFGEYHTLWDAIARRATAQQAAWTLYDILVSTAPYLARYHCAAALLRMLPMPAFEPVNLSAASMPLDRHLATVRGRIEAVAGPRGAPPMA